MKLPGNQSQGLDIGDQVGRGAWSRWRRMPPAQALILFKFCVRQVLCREYASASTYHQISVLQLWQSTQHRKQHRCQRTVAISVISQRASAMVIKNAVIPILRRAAGFCTQWHS